MTDHTNFTVPEIVHAIQGEEELSAPLVKILKQPPVERGDALKRLAMDMKSKGAPQSLIDEILTLQRSDIADAVLVELAKGNEKQSFFSKIFKF